MYIFLSIFTGFTIVLSIILLGNLNRRVGSYQTALINFGVSAIAAIIIFVFTEENDFSFIQTVPIYLYLGALFAIMVTMLNSLIITKVPAVYTVVLVFTGQMLTGIVLDFFRSGNLAVGDLAGGLIILSGLLYNSHVDKNAEAK